MTPATTCSRTSLATGKSQRRCWTTICAPILLNLFSGIGMWSFHVHAEATTAKNNDNAGSNDIPVVDPSQQRDLWERILSGPEYLTTMDLILFSCIILLGMELLNHISANLGHWFHAKQIPVRGKHLDVLSPKDQLYIAISKIQTAPFTYLFLRYAYYEPNVLWSVQDVTLKSTLLPLPILYLVFDFFYTVLHWALHIKAIYGYIHKHHHHQKAPSRANIDAINVHPIEFFLGEYNYIWTLFLCCHVLQLFQLHVLGALIFLVAGGVLAGLNHTRFDIVLSLFGVPIFDSKFHDVHHRIPQSNYGQYTMFWDYVFGTFRPYDATDRVNPKAQLDPRTGKSLSEKSQ